MEKVILRALCISLFFFSTTVFSQGGNSFTGLVTYHNNFPMAGVTAYLHNSNGNVIDSATTDNAGNYTFNNVTPGNYTITFKTSQASGGVTLTDAFLVMLKLLNLYTFTPIQALAADVNGSGTITWTDYSLIVIGYLNQGNPFPVGPWVFEQSGTITIPTGARDGFTTRGGSSGDVNGSLVPDPKISSIFLDDAVLNITADPDDAIEFKLTSVSNLEITGMHLVIEIPQGLSILSVKSQVATANISVINDQVRATWMVENLQAFEISEGMPLLVITAKTTGVSRGGNSYSLKLSDESHFINTDGELISGVSLDLPTINLVAKKDVEMNVFPNPFMDYANLSILLQEEGHVIISLFDQAGRMIKEIANNDYPAGNQQFKIDGTDLIAGIYHYNIICTGKEQFINSGTIIKSK